MWLSKADDYPTCPNGCGWPLQPNEAIFHHADSFDGSHKTRERVECPVCHAEFTYHIEEDVLTSFDEYEFLNSSYVVALEPGDTALSEE